MHDPIDLIGDALLFSHDARSSAGSPERRLFAAVLEDVCFCLAPSTLVDRATRRDAAAWVRGEVASPAPCSFREICEILDLDEAATRVRLLALASGETPARRRRLDSLLRSARAVHRPTTAPARRTVLDGTTRSSARR